MLLKIEPQLLKKLLQANGDPIPFIVYLTAKTDLTAAASVPPGLTAQGEPDPITKRAAIINALQQTAQSSQAGVLETLRRPPAGAGISGQDVSAAEIKSLWIINAVAARGSLQTILTLAARPDVEIIRLDKTFKLGAPFTYITGNPHQFIEPDHTLRFTHYVLRTPYYVPGTPHYAPNAALPPFSLPSLAVPEWGVAKIRADLVHQALQIDGTGVVVANIDSGVDWLHPALQTAYRGYTGPGKLPLHVGNWFDATGEGATYPVDTNGHGTHTMGTIAGGNGIGVAPGAKWIAVRAFNSAGVAQASWLHNAFQWLLAPNGDPALAPHVVNNSWSSNDGFSTEFAPDIQALTGAGIYSVFAAGNNGPGVGSVGSPGSLNVALAVGATDINDDITSFSGRGPSPWGKIKPEISAPGKNVRSALPGGAYGELSGTSMAAPHAAGLAALLLQAAPALKNNPNGVSNAMMSTAVQLGSPIPNNNYGWGRIDAYNAVMSVASVGTLQGSVTQSGGSPIGNATIQIVPRDGGPAINTTSQANGTYLQGLAADTYDVTVSAFGYEPTTVFGLVIVAGAPKVQNFTLTPKPTGLLVGTVKDKNNPAVGLAATITIDGTPATTTSNPATGGSYSLTLPTGVYTVTVVAAGHRIVKATNITINDGATVVQNFLLDSAPTILLVDSGRWYQESYISYYQQALTDLLYPYDLWQITNPQGTPPDIPSAAVLANYDLVIWSSPFDSPGYIGADETIGQYLNGGGKLLLNGQDVAYYDGGGSILLPKDYFEDYLKAAFVQENSEVGTVAGAATGPLAGLSFELNGGDGADNQLAPDIIANAGPDFAASLLFYEGDKLAGLNIGLCVPYRAIFLPFGFEAINSRLDRSQVLGQAIDWLIAQPAQTGLELTPAQESRAGNFGATISHTVRIRNTGATADSFNLSLTNGTPYNWPVSSIPASISLASCQAQQLTVDVQIPLAQTWHISDTFTLTAQSTNNPSLTQTVTRTTKTPAPVLLVDDDRWYSFADQFKEALDANNIPYDYWLVPKAWLGPVPPSPPLETLQMYPMVVWYTAYDWYQPLTPTEEDRLINYLNGGGRLFFSSQDFLYRHLLDHGDDYAPFVQTYLGVQSHTEDFTSTLTIGRPGNLVGTHLGPYDLTFPAGYNNWTDGLTPTTAAQAATLGQAGQVNGIINAGPAPGDKHWHTAFLSYGPELLSAAERARLMQRSLGWLSWLGSSTVSPHASAALDATVVTYTAIITNDGWSDLSTAYFTATFPSELTPGSASPELSLSGGAFVWSGPLAQNQSKVFTYTATIAGSLPLGTTVSQTSWLAYPEHNILFDRVADIAVNFPDLTNSSLTVTPAQGAQANDVLTYTIVLRNQGLVDAPWVTTTNTLPHMLDLLSIDTPSQGSIVSNGNSFTWTTSLAQGEEAVLTYRAVINYETSQPIENTAYVDDDLSPPLALTARTTFKTLFIYLPAVFKKN
jgi:uncharacterized repeat protein (TIGR01451 family)